MLSEQMRAAITARAAEIAADARPLTPSQAEAVRALLRLYRDDAARRSAGRTEARTGTAQDSEAGS